MNQGVCRTPSTSIVSIIRDGRTISTTLKIDFLEKTKKASLQNQYTLFAALKI